MTTYTTTQTATDLSASGWYEILPRPTPVEPLSQNLTADWVIIGAGFAGLTAAKRLNERCPEDKVVVLEAQRIAWGTSGRNSGFMVDLPHALNSDTYAGELTADLKQIRMNRVAINYATQTVEQFKLQEHFSLCGKYHGAVDQRDITHLADFCKHLDRLNEPWTHLNCHQMAEITGTDFYASGVHTPGAAVIQPAGYIRGMALALQQRKRISIYENSPVVKIKCGNLHTVHTPTGKVSATKIILAVNGHAQSFGFHRKRLMHIFTFASMTRSLSAAEQKKLGGHQKWGLIPVNPLGSTVRRYRERLVIRNTVTYNPSLRTSERQIRRIGRRHDRSFRKRFPMLKNVAMQYRWGGALCLSLNSVPAFGAVDERIYSAVCQNGLGVAKGTYAGIAVADLATDNINQIVTDITSFDPPKKLYPQPFMTVAAKTMLWWKQKGTE